MLGQLLQRMLAKLLAYLILCLLFVCNQPLTYTPAFILLPAG
jgi:hypothetical protein